MLAELIDSMGGTSQEEIRGTSSCSERTRSSIGCGNRGDDHRIRRSRPGGSRVRRVSLDNLAGTEGIKETWTKTGFFEDSPVRWRTQESPGRRASLGGGSGFAGRAGNPWGSRVAASLDLQKPSRPDPPASDDGSFHQLPDGGRTTASGGVQPTGEPEDQRRIATPGSKCAVRAHQRGCVPAAEGGTAGHLGRRQEEGIGRRL